MSILGDSATAPIARQLRLVIREAENCNNLFVRLSPGVASDLLSRSRRLAQDDLSTSYPRESTGAWTCFKEGPSDSISFLPLCISFGGNASTFASYNGGICAPYLEKDTIEVPRTLISILAGDIAEFVSVYALPRIEHATQVLVEPTSVEDWELLEIYSNLMEEGGLLRQISIIYPNQSLALCVDAMDRVKMRVKEVTTRDSHDLGNDNISIWPDLPSNRSEYSERSREVKESPKCVLLVQDTEIIVEPKTRQKTKNPSWTNPFRLIPSDLDWGMSLEKLSSLTEKKSFHVDPGCVLIKSEQWPFKTDWAHIKSNNSDQMRVVRIMTSSEVPRNSAVLFIGTRLDLQLSLHRGLIYLMPLTNTTDARAEELVLEEIDFDHRRNSLAAWNIPNIALSNYIGKESISKCYYQDGQQYFPVGAVIPMPPTVASSRGASRQDRWFRITSKETNYCDAELIVQLDSKEILYLLSTHRRDQKDISEAFAVPDASTIPIPQHIALTSDWTKPSLHRINHVSSTSVILSGVSGSGKTYNALLLSALESFYFYRPMYYLDCKKLLKAKPRMNEILQEIDLLFTKAAKAQNCILILDDLDTLSPNLLGSDGDEVSERTHSVNPAAIDQSKLIGDRISHLLEAMHFQGKNGQNGHIFLIATCSSADSINSALLKTSQVPFAHTKVPILSTEGRCEILNATIRRHNPGIVMDFDFSDVARRTEGFIPRDFEKLCLRVLRSLRTNMMTMSLQDCLAAELENYTPIAQISNMDKNEKANISWKDIGGLFDVKESLESIVRQPLLYRRIYARAQIQLPRGVLLYGPSGCGKSFLVPALARLCNYPLITCKGPEVLDKYIGASEAKVRALFERASQMAPSILFLDELEALAPRRGSDSTGVTDRVVNQLLTFLDGVEDVSSGTVFIIGATSRPDSVDPAICRPGRLERHLYVGPPNSSEEWSDLLIKIATNWNVNTECLRALSEGGPIVNSVANTPRLCPADIRAAFDTAHLNAVHRALKENVHGMDVEKIEICIEDMRFGLNETNPSLSERESRTLESIYKSFRGDRPDLNTDPRVEFRELKTSLR